MLHCIFMCASGSLIWHTRCDDNVIGVIAFKCFFYPIKLNPLDTLFIQNTAEKGKNLNGDVHVKTETKLFIPNAYFAHFLDGHLTALNSHLAQDNQIFRKPFKIIASSTLKKKLKNSWRDGLSPLFWGFT